MAQFFHHAAAPTPSRSFSTESTEMDYDEDILRHNKGLKERRDRLLQDLMKLEDLNKNYCDEIHDILKPLQMIPRLSKKSTKYYEDHEYEDESDHEHEEEEEEEFKSNHLQEIDEYKIPQIAENMNEEQKKDFISLLVRYLCISNKMQRHEIKSLYSKQTSLYFQAQGLRLEEQREFLNTLSMPYPAFQPLDKQNITEIQSLLAKFPGFVTLQNHFRNLSDYKQCFCRFQTFCTLQSPML